MFLCRGTWGGKQRGEQVGRRKADKKKRKGTCSVKDSQHVLLAILDRASDGHRLMQGNLLLVWWVVALECSLVLPGAYLSTHPVYRYKIQLLLLFFIILGGYGHTRKWMQGNIIFMRFCCYFKLAERLKNCLLSSQHTPSPNAH